MIYRMDTPAIAFTLKNRNINIVVRWLIYLAVTLTLLSIIGQLFKYFSPVYSENLIRKIDLNEENNIPTYFASMLLLLASIILGLITLIKYRGKRSFKTKWMILAAVFLFLSIEEIVGFHESVVGPLRSFLELDGFFYYAWVIPAFIMFCLFGLWYIPFLFHLPKRTRLLFVISGTLYVLGAVGVEMLGSKYVSDENYNVLLSNLIATLEEDMEMAGIICFIYTLLKYLQSILTSILFCLPVEKPDHAVSASL
jgi:hypothetical protein